MRAAMLPWPGDRAQRLTFAFVAAVIAALFATTTILNWAEDRFLTPAEGSLLIDGGSGVVYLYEQGVKRPIVNTETMRCHRRPGQHFIRYRRLDDIPTGRPIHNREGCHSIPSPGFLIQPMGGSEVYVSTGVSLRLIPNPRTLACLANLRPIEQVDPSYFDQVPIGPPVPDGENCQQ